MNLEELYKIISKPESECDGLDMHLRSKWRHNNAKAIFEITGLDVSHLLTGTVTDDGVIIKNPTREGVTLYV